MFNKEYNLVLQLLYGDNYMTPINQACGHNYPFYASQEKQLAHVLKENHLSEARLTLPLYRACVFDLPIH